MAAGLPVRARRHWRPLEPRALALAVAGACAAGGAWAQVLPAGGVAVHGQASISTPAPKQLVVTTRNGAGTGHSVINWQSFSLSAGSSARFVQPDAASLSINRVVTNTPSAIFGNLSSNGRLVLVNQSGITVGAGAVVDTAGFTASALRMTDADALAGRLRFGSGGDLDAMGGAAGLTVDGRITARDGDVVLIAPRIDVGISALVQSPNGSTILAAGQQVEITGRGLEGISLLVQARDDEARNLGRLEGDAVGIFAGTLRHSGAIQATTATLEGGQVVLQATGDALVQGTGTIVATGNRGGRIDVLGDRVAVTDQALINATGASGGGSIRIGGDFQGRNPDIPNARNTFLGPDVTLRADATDDGDGGRVIVWSDDYTQAHGAVSARGGPSGGDGGFVEVSGKRSLAFTALVDTRAPLGLTGTLLLDPDFIDVDANGTAYVGDVLFGAGSGLLSIDVATINASLSNVILQANEDINFNVAVSLANPGVSLTARAGGFLTVNGSITTKGGAVNLTAGDFGSLTGPNEGSLTVNQPIDTTGGGAFAAGAAVTLTSNLSDVGGNSIFINADIDAGTSSVALDALVGGPIDLAAGTITSGNLDLSASFDVNQTGGSIAASGVTLLDASNVILTRPGNNFNVFGGIANTVTVTDSNGITLGASSFSQLTVNANGNVDQNAAVVIGGITTINAGAGNVTLTTAGNNLNDLNVSGNALNIVEGAGSALAVLSLTSGLNQPVSLAAGHNLTLPGTTIDTGTADLTLISGNTLTLPGALAGNNISLTAVAGLAVNAPIAATGNFDATVTGGASTMTVIRAVTAGADMTLALAGNLSVLASGSGVAGLSAAGSQTISVGGDILLQGGGSGSSDRAVIESTDPAGSQAVTAGGITLLGGADGGGVGTGNHASLRAAGDQVITVGNGGITLTGGGGSLTDNYASIDQYGGAGTSQSITVNGTGSIVMTGGSSAQSGIGEGSYASIFTDNGDSQTITFTGAGAGRAITLTGGTNGSDAYAEIYATHLQTITDAGLITLTGGASGGAATDVGGDPHGNLALIGSDLSTQTITADGVVLQGGAAGINNLAALYGGANQLLTLGSGGLHLTGGGGGPSDLKNAAFVWKGDDVPGAVQTITVGGGGSITLQAGNSSGSAVGFDANLGGLSNGSLAGIRSDGSAQLIEFTSPGGSIAVAGGTVGSNNTAYIQARTGSQTIRGSVAANAPGIVVTGGSGGIIGEANGSYIGAQTGTQVVLAKSVTLNGGAGIDSFATITAPNQSIDIDGDLALQGASGTGSSPGARIGGRGGAAGSNTVLDLTVSGNLTVTAGATAGASIGSTSLTTGLTNDIDITAGGSLTLSPSAGAGVRIGSRTGDVQAGTITVSAGSITTNAGDGANNVAAVRTLGNISLTSAAGVTEAVDTVIAADGLSVSAANDILMDSAANLVTHLFASVSNSGDIAYSQAAGSLLTVTGITQMPTGHDVVISADDINITGAVVAPSTITIRPVTLARGVAIEPVPSGAALSLSPTELQQISTQGLIIGRLDGTGDVVLGASLASNDVGTGAYLSLFAGGNLISNTGASLGNGGTPFEHHVELVANNDVQLTNGNVFVADNRNLRVYADNDGSGAGSVNIGAVTLKVGTGAGNATGLMDIKGVGITAAVSGGGSALLEVTGAGNQTFTATGQDLAFHNLNAGSGNLTVQAASGTQTFSASLGSLDLQAGTGTGNSVTLSAAAGPQIVNADGVNLQGGAAGFNNSAFLFAGGGAQTITAGGSGLSLTGGGGTGADGNNSATITYSGTGTQTVSITGSGDMALTGGSSAAQNVGTGNGSRAIIESSSTGNQMITLTGGDLTLQGGSVGSRNYAALFADLGSQTISGVNNLLLHGGNSGGVATEGNRATVHAGVNQTISATSIDLIGGNDGTENYARFLLYGPGASTQTITADSVTLTGGAAGGGLDTGNSALIQSEASQSVNVGNGGDLTLIGGGGLLTDNAARIETFGGVGTQAIVLTGGGSILLTGGSSTATTVNATHGSRAIIYANAGAQSIDAGGGSIQLTGGNAGQRNFAGIIAQAGNQTISNAASIQMTGGAAGGVPDEGNFVVINSETGNQSITADSIVMTGGAAGTENLAQIRQGSASPGQSASQSINVTGSGALQLSGGAGSANFARIQSFGVSQTITMGSAATLSLTGGTGASNNLARIHAVNGDQTISGNPNITISGGVSGGADLAGNDAGIRASGPGAVQTIAAGDLVLQAGATGQENFAAVLALNQNISALGNVSLTGGGSATSLDGTSGGGARIGGMGGASPTATNLTLTVGSDLTLTGGSVAGAVLGSNRVGGQPTTIIAGAGGDITLNPGSAPSAGSRIGSPASGPSVGDIFLTAGGSIALGGAVAGETAIRTLGDVTLDATALALGNLVTGNTIFAKADGAATISGMGQLSASASSGDAIELVAGSSLSNSAGASALVTTAPARWLVYSSDPALDTRGGLAYDFKQYSKIFGDANPILGSGDGFLYAIAPTASVSLTGTVSKVYDGSTVATLGAGNFLATGGIDGDVVSVGGGASGSYDNRNAGSGKTVNVSGVTISALDGTAPVFGYALAGGTASGAVGTITKAPLTVSTGAVSKPYDGTTSAAGSAVVTGGALVVGDTPSGGVFAFLDPDVGSGKTVTVSGVTINDGNGGLNYDVSFTNNTVSSITALAAANWNGLGGDNLWSNPANWDVLPITGNVLSVAIPAGGGTVVFDATAGTTSLQSLTSQQAISVTGGSLVLGASLDAPSLNQSGGALQVGTSLATGSLVQSAGTLEVGTSLATGSLTQNGGTLLAGGSVTAGSFSQGAGASLSGTGALTVGSSFSQSGGSVTMGSIAINQSSGNLVTGNLVASTISLAAPAGAIGQTGVLNAAALATQSANGTNLSQSANQIASLAASNSGAGDIVLVNGTALTLGTIANAGGNIDVVNTGAINAVGPVTAPAGNVTIVANSPLTVGSGGITAGGDIVLHATNLTSAGNLTLDGALVAGNTVSLTADANLVQNFAVVGANGVTATAAGGITYGPFATTNAPPILYTAGGVPITPPPTVLASSLQPPGDIIVTFLELLAQAVDGPTGGELETNPDGSKKKRDEDEGIVTEEELCR